MRIAVFIKRTTLHDNYGGIETQNKELCEGLVRFGHEVHVFSPRYNKSELEEVQNGVKYFFVPCKYKMGLIFGFFGRLDKNNWINKSVELFEAKHEDNPYDLVLSQSSAGVGVIQNKNNFSPRVKAISIAHGSIMNELDTLVRSASSLKDYFKLIPNIGFVIKNFFTRQREFVLKSNHVIAVSSFVKKALIDETFVSEDRVTVIHNGINSGLISDISADAGLRDSAGITNFIYVGRLDRSKGLHILIQALYEILFQNKQHNFSLKIVGGGPEEQKLKDLVSDKQLQQHVKFVGQLSHTEVFNLMAGSDVFVLPTLRKEGYPMTLVEAMFSGLAIIASDIGGISDAVESGKNGILVTPGNVDELKKALIELIEDRIKIDEYAKNGFKKAQRDLTLESMLTKYQDLFEKVLNKK